MALSISEAIREDDISSGITKNIKTGTDGGSRHIQFMALADENGDHFGITGAPAIVQGDPKTWYSSGETKENQKTAKASPGVLWSIACTIDPADNPSTRRWLMVFDKATAPVNTDIPVYKIPVAGGGNTVVEFPRGMSLATGVSVALSSTVDNLTLPTAENFFEVEYE
jgi:hypothetical protein